MNQQQSRRKLWLLCSSLALCVPCSRRGGNTTVLRSGDNFQFQFLEESDFRSVVAVHRHFLEDGEEIVLHLCVAALRLPKRRAGLVVRAGPDHSSSLIERTQKRNLLIRRSVREVLAQERVALLVHIGEAAPENSALFIVIPFGENDLNEFIVAPLLCPA